MRHKKRLKYNLKYLFTTRKRKVQLHGKLESIFGQIGYCKKKKKCFSLRESPWARSIKYNNSKVSKNAANERLR